LLLAKKTQRVREGRDVVEHVGISPGQWEARESAESAKLWKHQLLVSIAG
jgi:hypothetical protein